MVKTIIDLFERDLQEIYFMENFLVGVLDKLMSAAYSDNVSEELFKHKQETLMQIERLKLVFDILGMEERGKPMHALKDIEIGFENFFRELTTPEAADHYVMQAAMKLERMEITLYENLIILAKEIDFDDKKEIISLFRDNLYEEEKTLAKLQSEMKSHLPFMQRGIH